MNGGKGILRSLCTFFFFFNKEGRSPIMVNRDTSETRG